jgi:hypothetical protein
VQYYLISSSSYDDVYNILSSFGFVPQSSNGKVLLLAGSSLSTRSSSYLIVNVIYIGNDTSGVPSEVRLVSRSSDGTVQGAEFFPPQNSGNGEVSLPETDAQVYWRDDDTLYTGNATVKVIFQNEGKEWIPIADAGTVTNGKLTLNLPSFIPDQYLTNQHLTDASLPVTVTPNDLLSCAGVLFLYNGDTRVGTLYLTSEDSESGHEISYIYFSKAGTIEATFTESGYTGTVNIKAKAGWNVTIYNYLQTNMTWTTDLSNAPSDFKWTLRY